MERILSLGGVFPRGLSQTWMSHKNKKRNKKKTYLTVCKQDDGAQREQGSLPLGLRGSRETHPLTTRFLRSCALEKRP